MVTHTFFFFWMTKAMLKTEHISSRMADIKKINQSNEHTNEIKQTTTKKIVLQHSEYTTINHYLSRLRANNK